MKKKTPKSVTPQRERNVGTKVNNHAKGGNNNRGRR